MQELAEKCLFAVRHAPTLSDGLCVGDADVPCAMPAPEAAAAVLALIRLDTPAFTCVWSSPRERCLASAQIVAERLALPLRVDERLREISLGRWQMQTWNAIRAGDPRRFQAWMENWLTQSPPGGETPEVLLGRVRAWWNELTAGQHLLLAHAGVVRSLRVLVQASSWSNAMRVGVPHLAGEWFAGPAMPRPDSATRR